MLFLLFPITAILTIGLLASLHSIEKHAEWVIKIEEYNRLRLCANRLTALVNYDHAAIFAKVQKKSLPSGGSVELATVTDTLAIDTLLETCESKALHLGYEVHQQGYDSSKSKVPNFVPRIYAMEPYVTHYDF